MFFVLLHGMSFSEYYSYSRKVKLENFSLHYICDLAQENVWFFGKNVHKL